MKNWKLISFSTPLLLFIHSIVLGASITNYGGENILSIIFGMFLFHLIPIIVTLGISFIILKSKSRTTVSRMVLLKMLFMFFISFFFWILVIAMYHNPNPSEFYRTTWICFSLGVLSIILVIFEAYKIKKSYWENWF